MIVMFVCTGNTCRSPMGEGILKKIVSDEGLCNIECCSSGIFASNGQKPSVDSVLACEKIGVDISNHLSKNIMDVSIGDIDVFVAMTKSHAEILYDLGVDKEKVYVLEDVQDPFGLDKEEYEKCCDQIQVEVNKLWKTLKKKLN